MEVGMEAERLVSQAADCLKNAMMHVDSDVMIERLETLRDEVSSVLDPSQYEIDQED